MDHPVEIDRKSWHRRVRNWTYSVQGKQPPEVDNLCHYVQTVLVYAPFLALFRGYTKHQLVPVHFLMFLAGIIALIGSFSQPVVATATTQITFVIGVLGFYLMLSQAFAMILFGKVGRVDTVMVWLMAVVTAFLAMLVGQLFWHVPATVNGAVNGGIPLWWMALSAIFLPVLMGATWALAMAAAKLLSLVIDLVEKVINHFPMISSPKAGDLSLVWTYLKAKKNRICPILHVPVD